MGRKGVPERKPNSPVILIFSRSWKTSGNRSSYRPMSVTGMLRLFPRLPRKALRHAIDPRPIPRLSATRSWPSWKTSSWSTFARARAPTTRCRETQARASWYSRSIVTVCRKSRACFPPINRWSGWWVSLDSKAKAARPKVWRRKNNWMYGNWNNRIFSRTYTKVDGQSFSSILALERNHRRLINTSRIFEAYFIIEILWKSCI